MQVLQIIPFSISYDEAAIFLMGVGLFCWLAILVDLVRLVRKTRKGKYAGFVLDPDAEKSLPKTVETMRHIYKQIFVAGLFFFGAGVFILIYTRLFLE